MIHLLKPTDKLLFNLLKYDIRFDIETKLNKIHLTSLDQRDFCTDIKTVLY